MAATGADTFSLLPQAHSELILSLASALNVVRQGVPLGTVKGKDFVPAWQLPYSLAFDTSSTGAIELPLDRAMRYLHGESLADVPSDTPRGFVTVNYNGRPMGFAKNIGRRANNLLPSAVTLRLDPSRLTTPFPLIKN